LVPGGREKAPFTQKLRVLQKNFFVKAPQINSRKSPKIIGANLKGVPSYRKKCWRGGGGAPSYISWKGQKNAKISSAEICALKIT